MGLDMYLNASRYLSDFNEADKDKKEAMLKLFPELEVYLEEDKSPAKEVSVEIGYWRKANAIHNWFVWNVQEGEDNCRKYYVDRNQLLELKDLCQKVLADNSLAKELLPPTSGFFFGSTDINASYFHDLEKTITVIDSALALPEDWEFEYQSSW
jgi:hypothetical protein